ncbi:hypothetical protein LguiA_005440 [Lonicera macranthoides]
MILITATATFASGESAIVTFIFGDSLTEVGNNNHLQYSLAKSNYPYYGIDYEGGKATGRFTNGRTIGDIISEKLGIAPPPAYLSLSQNDDAILKGVNYASGGAGILNDTGLKMIFHGLGPLGCIPSQRVKSKRGQCLNQVNQWILHFNARVQKLTTTLNRNLPSAQIAFADTYQSVLDLINNPTAYGFKVSNTSCCNVDTSLGGLCLPNSKLCKNRKDYVFWDAFHPSDAANAVLAEKFFSILFPATPSAAPSPN